MIFLVTGCAGFIGSHTCENLVRRGYEVVGVDSLTYASRLSNISSIISEKNFTFFEGDISDHRKIEEIVSKHKITHIINFAAETHVDNSIKDVFPFVRSNILGVCTLIEIVKNLNIELIHISTDEVYGVPGPGECFDESSSLNPKNPYAATKASADHLIFSAINTFGIRAKIIRPSNNFGPRQHSEKFIPTILQSLASGNKVPVYGDGLQKREWTFVKDTAQAIADFCQNSDFGNGVFNLSSENQLTNIEIIKILCNILDRDVENTVDYVKDRPGHDREYKIKNSILKEKTDLVRALQETVIEFKKNMEKK